MKIATIIKALNSPIRRDIITRLREGPISAGDLAAAYAVSKPTMSTHFSVLKEADLIEGMREGTTITYQLNVTVAEEALVFFMDLLGRGKEPQHAEEALKKHHEEASPSNAFST